MNLQEAAKITWLEGRSTRKFEAEGPTLLGYSVHATFSNTSHMAVDSTTHPLVTEECPGESQEPQMTGTRRVVGEGDGEKPSLIY